MGIGGKCNSITYCCVISVALTIAQGLKAGTLVPPAQIEVYGEHSGGNIVYHYKVTNFSDKHFWCFNIGYTSDGEETEISQLNVLPIGAKDNPEYEGAYILPPESTTQPPGWAAKAYGGGLVTLEWCVPRENKSFTLPVKNGETLGGFSVTVPASIRKQDLLIIPSPPGSEKAYVNGDFTVRFPPPTPAYVGKLKVIDRTPPTLAVSVNPDTLWPPNGQLETVNVAITVRDDYDPQPAIRLESITANETLASDDIAEAAIGEDDRTFELRAKREGSGNGRTYTITYSATDAVGNSTRSTAAVVVPHDQRGRN